MMACKNKMMKKQWYTMFKRCIVKNKIIAGIILAMILMTLPLRNAMAYNCAKVNYNINIPDVNVMKNLPVGSLINRGGIISPSYAAWKNCTNTDVWGNLGPDYPQYFSVEYARGSEYVMTIDDSPVYATGIPGVGYTFRAQAPCNDSLLPMPATGAPTMALCTVPAQLEGNIDVKFMLEFYKTGRTGSGIITGTFAAFTQTVNGVVSRSNVTMNNVVVVTDYCSTSDSSLMFPMGNIPASSFGSSIGIIPAAGSQTKNLGLECDAGSNIQATLIGTQNPDISDPSILALTGQGTNGVAKGVGVQMLYNGTPLQLNTTMDIKQSAGGTELFPLTVRYYQTLNKVTPGSANASATLVLTYQ